MTDMLNGVVILVWRGCSTVECRKHNHNNKHEHHNFNHFNIHAIIIHIHYPCYHAALVEGAVVVIQCEGATVSGSMTH